MRYFPVLWSDFDLVVIHQAQDEKTYHKLQKTIRFWKRFPFVARVKVYSHAAQQNFSTHKKSLHDFYRPLMLLRDCLLYEREQSDDLPFWQRYRALTLTQAIKFRLMRPSSKVSATFHEVCLAFGEKLSKPLPNFSGISIWEGAPKQFKVFSAFFDSTISDMATSPYSLYFNQKEALLVAALTPGVLRAPSHVLRFIDQLRAHPEIEPLFTNISARYFCELRAFERGRCFLEPSSKENHSQISFAKTNQERNRPFCSQPFETVRITCEGEVSVCCYLRKTSFGNVTQENFDDIWFGPKLNQLRKEIILGKLPIACQEAVGCPHQLGSRFPTTKEISVGYPKRIDLDPPNTHCNIGGVTPSKEKPACVMCERSSPSFRPQTTDRLFEILPRLEKLLEQVETIHIQGVAEALWKNYFFEALKSFSYEAYRHRIRIGTTTNGIVFDEKKQSRFFMECPLHEVFFSLDAATRPTYQKIRRLDAFETVVKHLTLFSKNRHRSASSFLAIQNNINLWNVHETQDMVLIAADCGADLICFNPTYGSPKSLLVTPTNAHLFQRAQDKAKETAHRRGISIQFVRPLAP